MTARGQARRAPFSLGAAAIIMVCYSAAGIFAALVPGLQGSLRTVLVGAMLSCVAGVAGWLGAPHLAGDAPPTLPPPPLVHPFPETERLARRLDFDRQLDRALERAGDEHDVFEISARALQQVPPAAPAELLLTGGKRKTLVQVAEAGPDGEGPGCPVAEQHQCEAIRRNRTLRFASSDDLDACPHLHDRERAACSAVCVPVRILGEAVGVLHRTGTLAQPPTDLDASYLESLSSRIEARLSVMRLAPEPDDVDPAQDATGLYSRSGLEAKIRRLGRSLTPFALVRCDVDRLADYIACHGRPVADEALSTLQQTALRCLRPDDLLGRGGGDDLLCVLPDTSAADARRALERLGEELSLALNERELPPFTVSFGVVESNLCSTLDALLDRVETATAQAEARGRNQVARRGELATGTW